MDCMCSPSFICICLIVFVFVTFFVLRYLYCRGSVSFLFVHVIHLPNANLALPCVFNWLLLYLSLSSCCNYVLYMSYMFPLTLFVHVIHLPHDIDSMCSPSFFCICIIFFVSVTIFVIRYIPCRGSVSIFWVHVIHLPHAILALLSFIVSVFVFVCVFVLLFVFIFVFLFRYYSVFVFYSVFIFFCVYVFIFFFVLFVVLVFVFVFVFVCIFVFLFV